MNLTRQLSEFEYEIGDKIERVLNSTASSLAELRYEFRNFGEYSDVMFSTRNGYLCLHYTYREYGENDLEIACIYLPELFIEDFEEFMRQAK